MGERGSGTVLVLAAVAAIMIVGTGGLAVSAAVRASHQARSAADLAALAGAQAWVGGADEAAACVLSGQVVEANHAVLTSCSVDGASLRLTVEVVVQSALPAVSGRHARARARAGPLVPTELPGMR